MDKKTRRLTVSAMMTALSLAFLYFACIAPSGQVGFTAVASLFVIAAVIECGRLYGVMAYAAVSVLAFLIMPSKGQPMLFTLFFGIYPVLKSIFEGRKRVFEWIFKLASFNALLTAILFLAEKIAFGGAVISKPRYLVYLAGNVIFVLYDIGLSRLIAFYTDKISKRIKR